MNQEAEDEVTAMLNYFPQTAQNYEVFLASLDRDLAGISDRAIIEAARRYRRNEVHGQSVEFAPSGAAFITEARKRQEFIELRERPRLSGPVSMPRRGGIAPFEARKQRAWSEYGHRPVLFEDVSHERWMNLYRAKEVPEGSIWVACLGIVFGPEPKQDTAE